MLVFDLFIEYKVNLKENCINFTFFKFIHLSFIIEIKYCSIILHYFENYFIL